MLYTRLLPKYLLALFIFALPFQTRLVLHSWTTPFSEWTSVFLWGTDILLALLLIFWRPKFQKSDWLFIALLAVAVISISHALIPGVAWYRLLKLAEYILLFVCLRGVFRDTAMRLVALKAVVASAVFQAIIAILQYAFQHDLGLRLLGESVLNVHGQGVAVVAANAHSYLRAYGTFPHPNVLAVWLMLGIWALWIWRPKWHLYVLPMLLVALFLTFSRTAIAIWLIASAMMWFKHRATSKSIIIVTLATGMLFALIFWPQVYSRLHISGSDEAVEVRVFYNHLAQKNILLLGHGIGQFVPNLVKQFPLHAASTYQPAHNVYLLVLYEMGIAGLLVLLWFLALIVRRRPLILAFLVLALFDHYFWTLQQGALMFWGLLAFCTRDNLIVHDKSGDPVPHSV